MSQELYFVPCGFTPVSLDPLGDRMKRVFATIAAMLFLDCGRDLPKDPPSPRRSALTHQAFGLELSREGCFGPCPQYDLTVSGDGNATLNARKYMPFEGEAVGQMRSEYLRKIVRASNFGNVRCTTRIPDAEVVRLSVRDGEKAHTVSCSLASGD